MTPRDNFEKWWRNLPDTHWQTSSAKGIASEAWFECAAQTAQATQQQEPSLELIGYQRQRLIGNPDVTEPFWTDWEDCSKEEYDHAMATPDYQAQALYASYDDSLAAQQQEPQEPTP
jgi:hypothetical protein